MASFYKTLIQHLEFQPLSLQSPFTEDDLDIYHMKLAYYLHGIGHLSNIAEDVLPSAMREEMANDKLYRARRLKLDPVIVFLVEYP